MNAIFLQKQTCSIWWFKNEVKHLKLSQLEKVEFFRTIFVCRIPVSVWDLLLTWVQKLNSYFHWKFIFESITRIKKMKIDLNYNFDETRKFSREKEFRIISFFLKSICVQNLTDVYSVSQYLLYIFNNKISSLTF